MHRQYIKKNPTLWIPIYMSVHQKKTINIQCKLNFRVLNNKINLRTEKLLFYGLCCVRYFLIFFLPALSYGLANLL